jgi:hypothetical protein
MAMGVSVICLRLNGYSRDYCHTSSIICIAECDPNAHQLVAFRCVALRRVASGLFTSGKNDWDHTMAARDCAAPACDCANEDER